jgi:hypothetical protein
MKFQDLGKNNVRRLTHVGILSVLVQKKQQYRQNHIVYID